MAKPKPDVIRICKICGDEYHPNSSRQMTCNRPKDRICPICGKTYQVICKPNAGGVACSPECIEQVIIRKRTASAAKLIKVCKACGKSFTPKTVMDVFCSGPHYRNCVVCEKQFEYNPKRKDAPHTCSKECRYKLALDGRDMEAAVLAQKQTLMRKYGVENSMNIPGVKEKQKKTTFERYGGWYTQTEDYRKKTAETDLKKYGVDHHMRSPELIQKRIDKLVAERGVVNVFQLPEVKEKIKNTMLKKTGYDNISKVPGNWNKVSSTMDNLYGRHVYSQKNIVDLDNWYKFTSNPIEFILNFYDHKPTNYEISKHFHANNKYVRTIINMHNAQAYVKHTKSSVEEDILELLLDVCQGTTILPNDYSVLRSSELDFYIPDRSFAIEYNPTFTHNSSFCGMHGSSPKSEIYHYTKTCLCDDKNIFLMHIFGYDYTNHTDIIISMIYEYLGASPTTIDCSDCEIRLVSRDDTRKFMLRNNLRGNFRSNIRLGLYYDDVLVCMMTFYHIHDNSWSLQAMSSEIYMHIDGGYTMLFNYFISNFNPASILTLSERSIHNNAIYANLGFDIVSKSSPNYVWVGIHADQYIRQKSISKFGYKKILKDDSIDLSKTEKEIMEEHKFAQVYDSGTITWEWKQS